MHWVPYKTDLCADWYQVRIKSLNGDDAWDWCEITPGNSFTVYGGTVTCIDFYFKYVEDAVLFRLTWVE